MLHATVPLLTLRLKICLNGVLSMPMDTALQPQSPLKRMTSVTRSTLKTHALALAKRGWIIPGLSYGGTIFAVVRTFQLVGVTACTLLIAHSSLTPQAMSPGLGVFTIARQLMTVYLLQPFNVLRIDAYLMRTGFVQTMRISPIRNASAGLLNTRLFVRISTRLLARLSLKDKTTYYG